MNAAIACECVTKVYPSAAEAEVALQDASLAVDPSEACALIGPSGSGKTTLLSILGCLLRPTSGRVWIGGAEIDFESLEQLTLIRRHQLGFVFQQARLLPFLSVIENLLLVGRNAGLQSPQLERRANEVLARLGIERYTNQLPHQLSGGQRQRVAIARAIIHRPIVILADEPTAALDGQTGKAAAQLLIDQSRHEKSALIVVTHDTRLIPLFDRVEGMESGRIVA